MSEAVTVQSLMMMNLILFEESLAWGTDRQTDRQTDRHTETRGRLLEIERLWKQKDRTRLQSLHEYLLALLGSEGGARLGQRPAVQHQRHGHPSLGDRFKGEGLCCVRRGSTHRCRQPQDSHGKAGGCGEGVGHLAGQLLLLAQIAVVLLVGPAFSIGHRHHRIGRDWICSHRQE